MNVTGDRTVEHGLATVGYDDEGVAGAAVGHRPGRRPGRLPARPARWPGSSGLGRSNGCAFADSAGHVPCSGWPTCRCSRPPDGPSTDELIGRRRARHLRRRRQVLVDRHAALQLPVHRPAVLPDRERPARRPAARRRLPGDDHRLLGLDGGGRRPADLRARRRLQLRQGPARPGRGGQPRLPVGAVPRRQHPQHRRRRPADERARTSAAGARRAGAGAVHAPTAAS